MSFVPSSQAHVTKRWSGRTLAHFRNKVSISNHMLLADSVGDGGLCRMVFIGRGRQRRKLLIAALPVGTDGAGPRLQVRSVHIFFGARIFFHLVLRSAEEPSPLVVNRLRVKLRIDYGELHVQVAEVGTRPAL